MRLGQTRYIEIHGDARSLPGRYREKNLIFHYTLKHASWVKQIEIWFGILVKKVVKRFKRTYHGKVLTA